ncbi:hypothetical protein MMJ10_10710, partial [Enterococcus cecorum]|nr:hypothetical protein [Enterococcus cecorum]
RTRYLAFLPSSAALDLYKSQVSELDIDDYFDEKWSPEFGRENHLRPSQYIKQLQEDKAYLIQIYHEIVGQ